MNFIITGIGGHLGNTLANILLQRGDKVTGLALDNENVSMLEAPVTIVRGDLLDKKSLEALFEERCDVLIHCAGLISISRKNRELLFKVNVDGTQNIIDLCKEHNVRRLVYVSSVHAIAIKTGELTAETCDFDPAKVEGSYAQSKAMATRKVMDSGLDWVVVHPSGIMGPNDWSGGFLTRVIESYYTGRLFLSIKGGYEFVDVRDVSQAIIMAVDKTIRRQCYILSENYHEIIEIADIARNLGGRKPLSITLSMWVVRLFLPLCNLYFATHGEKNLLTEESTSILSKKVLFNHEKAKKDLGFHPRSLYSSVYDTLEFAKRNLTK